MCRQAKVFRSAIIVASGNVRRRARVFRSDIIVASGNVRRRVRVSVRILSSQAVMYAAGQGFSVRILLSQARNVCRRARVLPARSDIIAASGNVRRRTRVFRSDIIAVRCPQCVEKCFAPIIAKHFHCGLYVIISCAGYFFIREFDRF